MQETISALSNYFQGYGVIGLVGLAFIESIIFPVPPDPLLISMSLISTEEAINYALLTTIASVIGGMCGYALGVQAGRPLLLKLFKRRHIEKVTAMFSKYGGWAVFIAAFTPVPYKVFTISAGIGKVNFLSFVIASIVGRGLRFLGIGMAITLFGEKAIEILSSSFEAVTIGLSLIIVLAVVIYKYLSNRWKSRSN